MNMDMEPEMKFPVYVIKGQTLYERVHLWIEKDKPRKIQESVHRWTRSKRAIGGTSRHDFNLF